MWVSSFYYRRNKKQGNPFRGLTDSNMIFSGHLLFFKNKICFMTDEIGSLANLFTNIKRKIYFLEQSKRAVVYLTCTDDKKV
jgi:hypothetical protein